MIRKNCKVCGKFHWRFNSQIKRGAGLFCSRKCSGIFKRERKILKLCEYCGKSFYVLPCFMDKKYCGRRCSNRSRVYKKHTIECGFCGRIYNCSNSRIRGGYCSKKCGYLSQRTYDSYLTPEEYLKFRRKADRKLLRGHYVKRLISLEAGGLINIPEPVIELKRVHLKTKRELKRRKNGKHTRTKK